MKTVKVDKCSYSGKPGFNVLIPDNCEIKLDKNVVENGVTVIQVVRMSDGVRIGKVNRNTYLLELECPECETEVIKDMQTSTSTAVSSGVTSGFSVNNPVDVSTPKPVIKVNKLSWWKKLLNKLGFNFK